MWVPAIGQLVVAGLTLVTEKRTNQFNPLWLSPKGRKKKHTWTKNKNKNSNPWSQKLEKIEITAGSLLALFVRDCPASSLRPLRKLEPVVLWFRNLWWMGTDGYQQNQIPTWQPVVVGGLLEKTALADYQKTQLLVSWQWGIDFW